MRSKCHSREEGSYRSARSQPSVLTGSQPVYHRHALPFHDKVYYTSTAGLCSNCYNAISRAQVQCPKWGYVCSKYTSEASITGLLLYSPLVNNFCGLWGSGRGRAKVCTQLRYIARHRRHIRCNLQRISTVCMVNIRVYDLHIRQRI